MTRIRFASAAVAMVTTFAVAPISKAQGFSSCIEELALPGFASYI
jgi:hypothetical protein